MFRCLIFIRCLNTRESCVNDDVAKWGTNRWEIEETTLHKAGSSAVFNIAFEREGKKEVVTKRGIRIWSPIQVRCPTNRAQLCWADETWCCPCGIATLNAFFFLIFKIRKGKKEGKITDIGVTLILYCCLGLSDEGNSVSRTENFMNFFQWCYISSCILLPLICSISS